MYLRARGMTLIDVLVGTAIMLVIFLGLFAILRTSAVLSGASASKAAALAIANGKLEQLRSLDYAAIGTSGGIPAGTIPQMTTLVQDSVPYEVRTFISYYDDPKDGTGVADSNGIQADYKRAKITVSYETQAGSREVSVVSTFAPPGIETTTGGGTLRIVVVDAGGVPVPGAEVTVVNASTSPAINLTTFTDFAGYALFPGAATSTGYRVSATKSGWSTARTYSQDGTNQNPTPGHLTIAGGQTTTGTFAIDELAAVLARTFTPIVPGLWSDTFADATQLATQSGTAVTGGALTLLSSGGYVPSGNAVSVAAAPTYLVAWHDATFTSNVPGGTTLVVKVVDGAGTPIPDGVLSGNSAGFTASPISLASVSTTTYPSLALRAELTTNATTSTPSVLDWSLSYSRGPVPLPSISFTLTGAKTIGSTISGTPIYKTTVATTTDSSGVRTLPLEWDTYALSLSGYTVLATCPTAPFEILPGASTTADMFLATTTGNALRVFARDDAGEEVPYASVTLSRTGFTRTLSANACGFAYFGGLSAVSDYTVTASGGGLSGTHPGVAVSGLSSYDAILD